MHFKKTTVSESIIAYSENALFYFNFFALRLLSFLSILHVALFALCLFFYEHN